MKKKLFFLFTLLFLFFILNQRADWVMRFTSLPTTDGYFYLQEFRTYMEEGRSYYHTHSLFYRSVGVIGNFFELDPLTLFHVVVAFSFILLSFGCVLFLPTGFFWLAPATVSLVFLSDILFIRHYAFLRQGFSWSLFIFCLALLQKYKEQKKNIFIIPSILVAVFSATLHLFTAIAASFIFFSLLIKNIWLKLLGYILVGGSAYLVSDVYQKSLFSFTDLGVGLSWIRVYNYLQYANYELLEFSTYTIVAFAFIFLSLTFKKTRELLFSLSLLGVILILPIWSSRGGMDMRLSFGFIWVLIPTLCLSVSVLRKYKIGLVLFLSAYITMSIGYITLEKTPYPTKSLAADIVPTHKDKLLEWIPKGSFVLAPQGVNFAITYYLGLSSAKRMPKDDYYPEIFILKKRKNNHEKNCYQVSTLKNIPTSAKCILIEKKWVLSKSS